MRVFQKRPWHPFWKHNQYPSECLLSFVLLSLWVPADLGPVWDGARYRIPGPRAHRRVWHRRLLCRGPVLMAFLLFSSAAPLVSCRPRPCLGWCKTSSPGAAGAPRSLAPTAPLTRPCSPPRSRGPPRWRTASPPSPAWPSCCSCPRGLWRRGTSAKRYCTVRWCDTTECAALQLQQYALVLFFPVWHGPAAAPT